VSASGTEEKVLDNFNGNMILFDISRDGRYLVFNHQDPKTDFDIYMMDLQGEKKLVPVMNGPSAERNGRVSPDGKWLSYISNETGSDELFVTSFPVPGSRWQVSSGGTTGYGEWSLPTARTCVTAREKKSSTWKCTPARANPNFPFLTISAHQHHRHCASPRR
jgi:Tol biopolymer transport system component